MAQALRLGPNRRTYFVHLIGGASLAERNRLATANAVPSPPRFSPRPVPGGPVLCPSTPITASSLAAAGTLGSRASVSHPSGAVAVTL